MALYEETDIEIKIRKDKQSIRLRAYCEITTCFTTLKYNRPFVACGHVPDQSQVKTKHANLIIPMIGPIADSNFFSCGCQLLNKDFNSQPWLTTDIYFISKIQLVVYY